jgi:hypothetical protein
MAGTYCSGSMYTSAGMVSYSSSIRGDQLTLIINPNFAANHKFRWFLPIKRLPVVFMFRSTPSAPSSICNYAQNPFVIFVTHPRSDLRECDKPISLGVHECK